MSCPSEAKQNKNMQSTIRQHLHSLWRPADRWSGAEAVEKESERHEWKRHNIPNMQARMSEMRAVLMITAKSGDDKVLGIVIDFPRTACRNCLFNSSYVYGKLPLTSNVW